MTAAVLVLAGLAIVGWGLYARTLSRLDREREAREWAEVRSRPSWQRVDPR